MKPEFLIALSERLRRHARRTPFAGTALAVDLRCAALVARRHAALMVAEEAATSDGELRARLTAEAVALWECGARP